LEAGACKRSLVVDVGTLRCLSKYIYRERKYNDILERWSLKIYMLKILRMKIL
jgi:hypothetical protein